MKVAHLGKYMQTLISIECIRYIIPNFNKSSKMIYFYFWPHYLFWSEQYFCQGPRYFYTRYCDKKILTILSHGFQWPVKVTKLNPRYVRVFKSLPWWVIRNLYFYYNIALGLIKYFDLKVKRTKKAYN